MEGASGGVRLSYRRRDYFLRSLPLLFEGDNPMQSEFCSTAGLASLKFCHVCKVSAESKAEEQTEESIHQFLKCDSVAYHEDLSKHLHPSIAPLLLQLTRSYQKAKSIIILHFNSWVWI
ncbi:hypothetical protein BT69DRAFT_1375850 [Atractiella rhizophila]|nr:hypothetical protein BT69DRAFT_1375850 [Atractiella rhizophila]